MHDQITTGQLDVPLAEAERRVNWLRLWLVAVRPLPELRPHIRYTDDRASEGSTSVGDTNNLKPEVEGSGSDMMDQTCEVDQEMGGPASAAEGEVGREQTTPRYGNQYILSFYVGTTSGVGERGEP